MSQIRTLKKNFFISKKEVNTVSYQNSSEGYAAKKIHRYPEEHSECLKSKQAFYRQAVNIFIAPHDRWETKHEGMVDI